MAARKKGTVKMGRPPGPPEGVRRNRVAMTLTDAEFAELERLAGEKGLPLGTMLHRLVKRTLNHRSGSRA